MKKTLVALLVAVSSPLLSFAADAPARPDIEELLKVMRTEQSMQAVMEQVKQMIPQMMSNMAAQRKLSPEAVEKTKPMQAKLVALIQNELSWKKFKPEIAAIYAESMTPEEVKGIIAFYKSPAGQAFLDKQPIIIQKTMVMQQKIMQGLTPKIQAMVESEIKAAQ